ncbi:MAG: peptidoglycan-binding protein [Treponema sp.]|nr:peptidoglycan-binding protein [Treponema sp.]
MTCNDMLDKIYGFDGGEMFSLRDRLQIAVHVVFCPRCAARVARVEALRDILRTGFFPVPPPGIADSVMDRIYSEAFDMTADMPFDAEESSPEVPFGGWVVTGLIILLSLATAFMGLDFISVAAAQGSSFLLPVGITIGVVVTGYGALFIGSHLKELSDRFRLR